MVNNNDELCSDEFFTRCVLENILFFNQPVQNQSARRMINYLKTTSNTKSATSATVRLDGLSSLTRIRLFIELLRSCKGRTISISLNGESFQTKIMPVGQSGNFHMFGMGAYSDIAKKLTQNGKKVSNDLLNARKKGNGYHCKLPKVNDVSLNGLNLLLDFEVARRLASWKNDEYGETDLTLDLLPIGFVLMKGLELIRDEKITWEDFLVELILPKNHYPFGGDSQNRLEACQRILYHYEEEIQKDSTRWSNVKKVLQEKVEKENFFGESPFCFIDNVSRTLIRHSVMEKAILDMISFYGEDQTSIQENGITEATRVDAISDSVQSLENALKNLNFNRGQ